MCRAYLEVNDVPNPPFIRKLMRYFVDKTPIQKLTGPEIAAAIDAWIINDGLSLENAISVMTSMIDAPSIEAVRQHHKRYGRSARQLAVGRNKLRAKAIYEQWDEEDMSDEQKKLAAEDEELWWSNYRTYKTLQRLLFK
jgi:hypothetical protein